MIFDSLSNLQTYIFVHPLFHIVSDFINSRNIKDLTNGKINLSEGIYAVINEYESEDIKNKFIECHKIYIDIHIVIEGEEQIGICNKTNCIVLEEYDKEKDLEKLEGKIDFITLKKNFFAIFYPQDGHVPGLRIEGSNENKIKKVVFKVPYNITE